MEALTWTGLLGPILNPLMLAAFTVFMIAFVSNLGLALAGIRPAEVEVSLDGTVTLAKTPSDYALMTMKYATLIFVVCILLYVLQGIFVPGLEQKGILGAMAQRFLPVWIALIVLFTISAIFRERLGLYGKLFESPVGLIGFGLVMFWVFTAIFATYIGTHPPLEQIPALRNQNGPPGSALPAGTEGYPFYLLGGDNLGRDVFSRMVLGAADVLTIAPLATLFAFMVGITLGLPAGYLGGRIDTVLTFIANLVLAFPVLLLFFLLVTPEIVAAGIPVYMAAVLFLFPIIFFVVLFNSRFHTRPPTRNLLVAITLVIGAWAYLSILSDPNSDVVNFMPAVLDVVPMDGNLLIVFVSVVFVNSPTVFRIVRGITLDVQTRDYVAAAQTRGEGPWYIMLWEILPNARGPLIVDFCLRIGYTTILLGTLGFFGLGVSPESPDWGSTINEGRRLLTLAPHPALAPALALMSLVLGLNLLADGLREESLKD
ncbi:MAG: ABC transporter permease [Pseudomonadota bacterium]